MEASGVETNERTESEIPDDGASKTLVKFLAAQWFGLHTHCQGRGFSSWPGNSDLTSHTVLPEKEQHQQQSVGENGEQRETGR